MKIYNNNCLDILKNFSDKSIDYVFTSPPYNIKRTKGNKYHKYDFEKFQDNQKNYFEWCVNVIDELLRVTKNHIFWNVQANYYNKKDVHKLIGHYSNKIQQNFIWHKPANYIPSSQKYYVSNVYEYILGITNQKYIKSNKIFIKNHLDINGYSKNRGKFNAVMNPEVSDFFIKNFTKKNEIVLDPFMGTGTTGMSCIKYQRKFIGIELVEDYYNYAKDRFKNNGNISTESS
tara:strand:+ start:302 stop:994 length:693 start_codon:yes stop_codon:yes gene_type:complete